MAKINADNRVVPISQLTPNTWNPKADFNSTPEGKKNYARIKKSVAKFGQIGAILVRETGKDKYEIINGFHRYTVAMELGWKEVEIKNLGKLTDVQAKARALGTEDASIPLDRVMTAKMVKEILGFDPANIDELPYTQEEAEEMEQMLAFDWDKLDSDVSGIEPGTVDTSKVDMGKDMEILIPKDRITDWLRLKEIHGVKTDKQMIVFLIELGLNYEE